VCEIVGCLLVPDGGVAGSGVNPTTLSYGPLPAPCMLRVSTCFSLSFRVFSMSRSSVMRCDWLAVGEVLVDCCGRWLVSVGPC
jgi:hypothetical protein